MIYEIQKNNGESFQVKSDDFPSIVEGVAYFYEITAESGPKIMLAYKLAEGDSIVFVCD